MTISRYAQSRFLIALLAATLLLGAAGSSFAAETHTQESVQLAQFSSGQMGGDDDFDSFDDEYDTPQVADPLYYWNKVWFDVNDGLYHGVFKPLATGYAWLIPAKPRTWVDNFFTNWLFPVRFINNLLTGKFEAAFMEVSQFVANTAFGFGGLGNITKDLEHPELDRPTADGFGQTLGKAGMGHGFYLVWPFFGPSSLRETAGLVADHFCDPMTYLDLTLIERVGIKAYKNVNALSLELENSKYEAITEGAVDKYAAVRDAYIRFRAKKVDE